MPPPRTLKELRDMPAGIDRIKAAGAYIAEREAAIEEARAVRNADIRELLAKEDRKTGPAAIARATGLSISTIKLVKGQA